MYARVVHIVETVGFVGAVLGMVATAIICALALVWSAVMVARGEFALAFLLVPGSAIWLWVLVAFVREFALPELRKPRRI